MTHFAGSQIVVSVFADFEETVTADVRLNLIEYESLFEEDSILEVIFVVKIRIAKDSVCVVTIYSFFESCITRG